MKRWKFSIRKEKSKKAYVEVKIYGKNEPFICEIVKEENTLILLSHLQTAKVKAKLHDKCLVKMERTLNLN